MRTGHGRTSRTETGTPRQMVYRFSNLLNRALQSLKHENRKDRPFRTGMETYKQQVTKRSGQLGISRWEPIPFAEIS